MAVTLFVISSPERASLDVTFTVMSCATVEELLTRTSSYGPEILLTAARTSVRSPSVASPAVPVTITLTVPCPLGWLQSACANRTPRTDSAALTNVSSVARCASSDHERRTRERKLSSSSVSLPSWVIQSVPLLIVTSPMYVRVRLICPSGTLYREPSVSASTKTSTVWAPFCSTDASSVKKRSSSPLTSLMVLKTCPFEILIASPFCPVRVRVTTPWAFCAFLRFFP
ncbi:hypothetical protein SDC9_151256 [bioreactor metagenome]|uniref:Uncharacterized protein n=1 Tax=bioreactor metagenome TaxID=1076179 RepID=A0A645ERL1_9ZZZZ